MIELTNLVFGDLRAKCNGDEPLSKADAALLLKVVEAVYMHMQGSEVEGVMIMKMKNFDAVYNSIIPLLKPVEILE